MRGNLEKIKYAVGEMRDMLGLIADEVNGVLSMTDTTQELKSLTINDIEQEFGTFKYVEAGGGRITVTDNWRYENIVMLEINYKKIWCNKKLVPQFAGVFGDIIAGDLWDIFDIRNGGCYMARHAMWDISRELSIHAWGAALDLNPDKYPYGSDKRPPDQLIELFGKWGFYWGGNWSTPDPMHFQWSHYVI